MEGGWVDCTHQMERAAIKPVAVRRAEAIKYPACRPTPAAAESRARLGARKQQNKRRRTSLSITADC